MLHQHSGTRKEGSTAKIQRGPPVAVPVSTLPQRCEYDAGAMWRVRALLHMLPPAVHFASDFMR
eukprot:3290844-Pleurochrysis_carterae.AAC.1